MIGVGDPAFLIASANRFLTCVSHTAHVIDIGWTPVCPPHADIVSKRLNLSSLPGIPMILVF